MTIAAKSMILLSLVWIPACSGEEPTTISVTNQDPNGNSGSDSGSTLSGGGGSPANSVSASTAGQYESDICIRYTDAGEPDHCFQHSRKAGDSYSEKIAAACNKEANSQWVPSTTCPNRQDMVGRCHQSYPLDYEVKSVIVYYGSAFQQVVQSISRYCHPWED